MISLLGLRDNLWQLRENLIYNLHTSDRFQLPKDRMTDETSSRMTSQESEYFFEHIKDAIVTLRLGRQRPDNKKDSKACTAIRRNEYRPVLHWSNFTGDGNE